MNTLENILQETFDGLRISYQFKDIARCSFLVQHAKDRGYKTDVASDLVADEMEIVDRDLIIGINQYLDKSGFFN